MTLLYIYLGSLVYHYGTIFIAGKALNKELRNLGYEKNEMSKNNFKTLIEFIQYSLLMAVPILNVAATTYFIFKFDEILKETIEEGISKGEYVLIKEAPKKEYGIKEDDFKVITYNVNNELSTKQKIEFLKQELSRLTGEEITLKEKKERQKRR